MMNLVLYIDGGARGNPGPAAVGVVIQDESTRAPLHEAGYWLGTATNNTAEYQGLIRALTLATDMKPNRITIYSDSELLVRQITGQYRVKSTTIKPLFENARKLLGGFSQWEIHHVRREKNKRADELANMSMDARRDVIVNANPSHTAASQATTPSCDWTVVFCTDSGLDCPVKHTAGQRYPFGTATPQGLCVYAAQAALNACLRDTKRADGVTQEMICSHCDTRIHVDVEIDKYGVGG